MQYFKTDTRTALEAKQEAERIAFAPAMFQACRIARDCGMLEVVLKSGHGGSTLDDVAELVQLPRYGIKLLLEAGLGIGLFCRNDGKYTITKLGHFLLRDTMTRVNMDVVHNVCYRGLFDLDTSLAEERPAGLATLGEWPTLYEGLSSMPDNVAASWLAFDHYYSDRAFPAALPIVFENPPKRLLDVGGNTGRWATACVEYDPKVRVTIADLPQQLELARQAIQKHQTLAGRIDYIACDFLDESTPIPSGFDTIWMSQFLDCFSETEIVSILHRAREAIDPDGTLYILELCWDQQPNETAAFCLQQTSLYFACIANGNSQMYHSDDLRRCIREAGLSVVREDLKVGGFHTLLTCGKT